MYLSRADFRSHLATNAPRFSLSSARVRTCLDAARSSLRDETRQEPKRVAWRNILPLRLSRLARHRAVFQLRNFHPRFHSATFPRHLRFLLLSPTSVLGYLLSFSRSYSSSRFISTVADPAQHRPKSTLSSRDFLFLLSIFSLRPYLR